MNTIAKNLFAAAAIAVAFAGSARAQEADADTWMQVASTKTRAQVQAELLQARADGSLRTLALGYLPVVAAGGRTRADVAQAVKAARRSGEYDYIHAEAWMPVDRVEPLLALRVAEVAR